MALLWRADASDQAGSPISFDESSNSDVIKFFFVCENIVMRRKSRRIRRLNFYATFSKKLLNSTTVPTEKKVLCQTPQMILRWSRSP